ncbi:MAG: glycosyltransferase family 39 protein [Acidimicrobiales bacterium]
MSTRVHAVRDPAEPTTRGPWYKSRALAVSAVVAAGAAACLFRLGAPSFWLDEAISVGFARLWWDDLWREISLDGGNQGLYYVVLSGWRLAGDGEVWLRLLSVVPAVAALVVFYRLALRLFGHRIALVALALLAVSPFFVRHAREVRAYPLWILLVTASTLALLHAVDTDRARNWALYSVVTVAAVWAHLFGLFFVAGQVLALLAARRAVAFRRRALVALTGVALAVLPVMYLSVRAGEDRGPDYLQRTTVGNVRNTVTSLAGDRGQAAAAVVIVLWAVALVTAARATRRRPLGQDSWPWAITLGTTVVPPALALAAVLILPIPAIRDKYLIAALPGACLLAAVALDRLRWRPVASATLAFLLSVSAWRIVDRADAHHQGEDWRGIVELVMAEARPGDRFIFHSPWMSEGFKYYLREARGEAGRSFLVPGRGWLPFAEAPVRHGFLDQGDLAVLSEARSDGIWVVLHDIRGPLTLPELEAGLERTHRVSKERSFSIITVRKYLPVVAAVPDASPPASAPAPV